MMEGTSVIGEESGPESLLNRSDFCDFPVSRGSEGNWDSEGTSEPEENGLNSDVEDAIYAQMFFQGAVNRPRKGRRRGSSKVEEYKFEIPNAPGSPDNCMSVSLVMADDSKRRRKRGRPRLRRTDSAQEESVTTHSEADSPTPYGGGGEESRCSAAQKRLRPFGASTMDDHSNNYQSLSPKLPRGIPFSGPVTSLSMQRGRAPADCGSSTASADVIVIGSSSEEGGESSDVCEINTGSDSDLIIVSDSERDGGTVREGAQGAGDRRVKMVKSTQRNTKTAPGKTSTAEGETSSFVAAGKKRRQELEWVAEEEDECHKKLKVALDDQEEEEGEGEGSWSEYSTDEDESSLSEGECSSNMELCSSGDEVDGPWQLHKKDVMGRDAYERMTGTRVGRYYGNRFQKCTNCKQKGHVVKDCPQPKRHLTCYLCAGVNHITSQCREELCTYCYASKHRGRSCAAPWASPRTHCTRCYMTGHHASICTDLWRQFHNTTHEHDHLQKLAPRDQRQSKKIFCYNCGQSGHFGFECTRSRPRGMPLPHFTLVARYDDHWKPRGPRGRPGGFHHHDERPGRTDQTARKRPVQYSSERTTSKRPCDGGHFSDTRKGKVSSRDRSRRGALMDEPQGLGRRHSEPLHRSGPSDRWVEANHEHLSITIPASSYDRPHTTSPFTDARKPLLPSPTPVRQHYNPPRHASLLPRPPPPPTSPPLPPPPPPPPPPPRHSFLPNHPHAMIRNRSTSEDGFPRTPFRRPDFPDMDTHQRHYSLEEELQDGLTYHRKNHRRFSDADDRSSHFDKHAPRALKRSESYAGYGTNARGFRGSEQSIRMLNSAQHRRYSNRY